MSHPLFFRFQACHSFVSCDSCWAFVSFWSQETWDSNSFSSTWIYIAFNALEKQFRNQPLESIICLSYLPGNRQWLNLDHSLSDFFEDYLTGLTSAKSKQNTASAKLSRLVGSVVFTVSSKKQCHLVIPFWQDNFLLQTFFVGKESTALFSVY